jgi:hypothetical protein
MAAECDGNRSEKVLPVTTNEIIESIEHFMTPWRRLLPYSIIEGDH